MRLQVSFRRNFQTTQGIISICKQLYAKTSCESSCNKTVTKKISAIKLKPDGNWAFQNLKSITKWLKDNQVKVLKWPAQSHFLNHLLTDLEINVPEKGAQKPNCIVGSLWKATSRVSFQIQTVNRQCYQIFTKYVNWITENLVYL